MSRDVCPRSQDGKHHPDKDARACNDCRARLVDTVHGWFARALILGAVALGPLLATATAYAQTPCPPTCPAGAPYTLPHCTGAHPTLSTSPSAPHSSGPSAVTPSRSTSQSSPASPNSPASTPSSSGSTPATPITGVSTSPVQSSSVAVSSPGAVTSTAAVPVSGGPTTSASSPGQLANTGSNDADMAVIGALFVLGGSASMLVFRRKPGAHR